MIAPEFTLETARTFLAQMARPFSALGSRIVDLQHRAAEASYRAKISGDQLRADQLKKVILQLGEVHGSWLRTMDRWASLRDAFGLGAFPVLGAAAVIAVAVAVVAIFTRTSVLERFVGMLESGIISPEQFASGLAQLNEAKALEESPADKVVKIVKWGVIGAAVLVGYNLVAPVARRS